MHHPASKPPFDPSIPVSPNNPCPFLRGLVGEGFVEGGTVPLNTLSQTIANATGETGLKKVSARIQVRGVALIANGFKHILKSIWSGAQLDALRGGPLDKRGAGSRILGVDGKVNEDEIARLASYGRTYTDPNTGSSEPGLNATEINTFMRDNLKRAGSAARWYYPLLMKFEWPILLKIIGKGKTDAERYLSVADVRTLFNERRFPDRINQRIVSQPLLSTCQLRFRWAVALTAFVLGLGLVALVAIAEFPNQVRAMLPQKGILVNLLPPPLPAVPETKAAFWLEQNWSLKDRHWFHHASQGTATFPVPYEWFMALEQPRLHLFSKPGMMKDSAYLESFGFIPSPQSIQTDTTTLRRFGYANVYETTQVPDWSTRWTPAENVDGLPVGFARMTGVVDPATGHREEDKIGLTCAACHTGQIHYQGVDVRFDGGPAMTDLKKLELSTGLSIAYTLYVPFRFQRFADRVLGPDASKTDRAALKQKLSATATFLIDWAQTQEKTVEGKKTWDGKQQKDTEEGFGRLDALNRIGNQVFSQDLALSGVKGFEKNLHAQDAPVSYPAIWTVPWFKFAQYDASIEQPLIRNAGEALGVTALLNLSDAYPEDRIWRSSVNIRTLGWIEDMLRGPDPFKSPDPSTGPKFGGLLAPKWPSQILGDAWRLKPDRIERGRAIYAEMCSGCHLPATDTPAFWSSKHWEPSGDSQVLNAVTIPLDEIKTDPEQSLVLSNRVVDVPGFLKVNTADLQKWWQCEIPTASKSPNEMVYALGLMTVVDLVARKWMDDEKVPEAERAKIWNFARKNCLNPAPDPRYRARPLNGIWATAPYLHNGSVPSLYWLLKPAGERPQKFCMGRRDYDPETVGFAVSADEKCKTGETEFSATGSDGKPVQGNSVLGHSFERKDGEPKRPGVIGRIFKDDAERYDLIEYLKTL
ncbi:di-heme-cytochrome C peroxidase [Bradyrhizobium sp. WYCCWR 12699]|uniref:di-heme-cytochrome C peroxidase n=1 Tax=Bradyrhizobium sp. WYCCWR 12699 TaxID=3064203 RepID=UPI0028A49232|nr:di-heme-cytochrome C peroxidase [Bradyrhizobium sp. WYCCWR 12699]MDT4739366.1 di-heme-cytochrome C peroxidase [Bradyrhizobium sp. WYCCWR 12699]